MNNIQSRIEDMSPDWKLELEKIVNGIKITIHGSEETRGNAVEFCNDWTRSPKTLKALRQVFDTMDPQWENRKAYKDEINDTILKLFIQEDGDCSIEIGRKTNTINIDFTKISEATKTARENVYTTIEEENNNDPILD